VEPVAEACDFVDNDCDGGTDEDCEPAALQADAQELDLGVAPVGGESAPLLLELHNPGELPTDLLSWHVAGPAAADFVVSSAAAGGCVEQAPLPAGQSCGLRIVLRPGEVGQRHATLTVQAGPAEVQVALTGLAAADVGPDLAPGFPVVRHGDGGGASHDYPHSLTLDSLGRAWATGYSTDASGHWAMVLWSFEADGTQRPGFPAVHDSPVGPLFNTYGRALAVDEAGDVWVGGTTYDGQGTFLIVIWKFAPDGSLRPGFPRVQDGPGRGRDYAQALVALPGGEVRLLGYAYRGPYTNVGTWGFDAQGDLLDGFPQVRDDQENQHAGDVAASAVLGNGGELWAVGSSTVAGNQDVAVWRFGLQADLRHGFPRLYDGPGARRDAAWDVAMAPDGSLRVTGYMTQAAGHKDLAVLALDANGDSLPGYPRLHDGVAGAPGGDDEGLGVAVDPLGNTWVCGLSAGPDGRTHMALLKLDPGGDVAPGFPVLRSGEGGGQGFDGATDVALDPAGAVWVVGFTTNPAGDYDFVLWKFGAP